eukprot:3014786-Rhodomonas_salina.1
MMHDIDNKFCQHLSEGFTTSPYRLCVIDGRKSFLANFDGTNSQLWYKDERIKLCRGSCRNSEMRSRSRPARILFPGTLSRVPGYPGTPGTRGTVYPGKEIEKQHPADGNSDS